MGTHWRVRVAMSRTADVPALEHALVAKLDELVAEMSHWQPNSLLSRFNRAAAGTWHYLPPQFAHVITHALMVAADTGGAFDPAIGALVNLWGFGPPGFVDPPSLDALASASARSGWRHLRFDPAARRLYQPGGLLLDLSGIAKGYAVDALATVLRPFSRHFLVEVGGELVGSGTRPDGEPWWVDLETPASLEPLRLALHECAVATSGDYVRGNHTIDPATTRPKQPDVASVSVIHSSAMLADAWASALIVLGTERGLHLAEERALPARFIVYTPAGIAERLTTALAAMLD